MQITSTAKPTHASRQGEYRARQNAKGPEFAAKESARLRGIRAESVPEFVGVDSEGIGRGKDHRAVLLGVGQHQYIAADLSRGLDYTEVFRFLYSEYKRRPKAAYVGFFLGYDFNEWLKSLPYQAAYMLLSPRGKEMRRMKSEHVQTFRRKYFPVRVPGWEIDMLGFKRLSIRPRPDGCTCHEDKIKCHHPQFSWMHICDAGSYFQMSFLAVINPAMWKDDPDGPVCTQEEYEIILAGKDKRATADLDDDMKFYNQFENEILSRVMGRLAKGFKEIGVSLAKDQWYGPGASASKWLDQQESIKNRDLVKVMPEWFIDACRKSYFGGWFEIFSHGMIHGTSWNYDINNAYPYATTKLPHICNECRYTRGSGLPYGDRDNVLVSATVQAQGNRIGPVPFRDKQGSILRPSKVKGWFWLFEIDAAERAGLVKEVEYHEWVSYTPCKHPRPYSDIERLYYLRLESGKNSAKGMSIKLNNNSIYGKFAQNTGSAPYNNWLYASKITAHCRAQILDAIATHPGGADSVLMVATDGICFDSRHPTLGNSTVLGAWEESSYLDLCLFKPGVYWHRAGKEALLKVKSRGVPKKEFSEGIELMEEQFKELLRCGTYPESPTWRQVLKENTGEYYEVMTWTKGWPYFHVPVNFRMKSCREAINQNNWDAAAEVQEKVDLRQDSCPDSKRRNTRYNRKKKRLDSHIHNLDKDYETAYYVDSNAFEDGDEIGVGFDGPDATEELTSAMTVLTGASQYDGIEWVNVWGGK